MIRFSTFFQLWEDKEAKAKLSKINAKASEDLLISNIGCRSKGLVEEACFPF